MNNKSRIALAIAAALGTAAMGAAAQTSTVQIGGSLSLMYGAYRPGGGNTPPAQPQGKNHDNLSLSEPEIWIHGEEKISNNMTAWFRCTSSFDLMGSGVSGASTGGQWCGRNSAIGFKGDWGNAFAGTWDTPHKDIISAGRGWWSGTGWLIGGSSQVLYNGSSSDLGNTNGIWNRRQARLISYHSPSFSGFNVKAAYSAQNEGSAMTTATLASLSPRLWSFAVEYRNGPVYVGVGHERHKDFNPTTAALGVGAAAYNGGTDTNTNIVVGYTFGTGTNIRGTYNRSDYDITNTTDLKKSGWGLFVDQPFGPHTIRGYYVKSGDSKGTASLAPAAPNTIFIPGGNNANISSAGPSTGAKGWGLSWMYTLSKRTEAGFVYTVTDNEANSAVGKGIAAVNAGATAKAYGLNVRHKF